MLGGAPNQRDSATAPPFVLLWIMYIDRSVLSQTLKYKKAVSCDIFSIYTEYHTKTCNRKCHSSSSGALIVKVWADQLFLENNTIVKRIFSENNWFRKRIDFPVLLF